MNNFLYAHGQAGKSRAVPLEGFPNLAAALFAAGYFLGRPLCAGQGRCGLCRVRYLSPPPEPLAQESRKLGPELLAQGWRLSCLRPGEAGAEIELPASAFRPSPGPAPKESGGPPLGLALDLGTTGIEWQAVRLDAKAGPDVAASGRAPNPQLGSGSEVLSRLSFAELPGGAAYLSDLVRDYLREVRDSLPGRLVALSLAGNSVMSYLAAGVPAKGLGRSPYQLTWRGGEEVRLADDLPPCYFAPLLTPFVGGDLSAGLTAITLDRAALPSYPFILADLGTNAEFLLARRPGDYLAASVPLGPALEGVGLSCGSLAGPGALVSFALNASGLTAAALPGLAPGAAAPGITGTGYLSLSAVLLGLGLLGRDGRFNSQGGTPLAARLKPYMQSREGEACFVFAGQTLFSSDVEEILKVKAAFNLALSALLKHSGLGPSGLAEILLAGSFGAHVGLEDLRELGFLPPGLGSKVRCVGNTSLAGARLMLNDPKAKAFAEALPAQVELLDLNNETGIEDSYIKKMVFDYVS